MTKNILRKSEIEGLMNFFNASVGLIGPFKGDNDKYVGTTPSENVDVWLQALIPMLRDLSDADTSDLPIRLAILLNQELNAKHMARRLLVRTDFIEIPTFGRLVIEYFRDGTVILSPEDKESSPIEPIERKSLQECLDELFEQHASALM